MKPASNSKIKVDGAKPVFVKNGTEYIKVVPEEVVCLSAKGDYCYLINIDSRQPVIFSRSFTDLMSSYFGKILIQIRRATAVNIDYVKKIDGDELTLSHGLKFSVTDNHKNIIDNMVTIV